MAKSPNKPENNHNQLEMPPPNTAQKCLMPKQIKVQHKNMPSTFKKTFHQIPQQHWASKTF